MHGVGELPEDGVGDLPELSTLPTGHRYQPLNVLDHSDNQHYILEKYAEDKGKEDSEKVFDTLISIKLEKKIHEVSKMLFLSSELSSSAVEWRK